MQSRRVFVLAGLDLVGFSLALACSGFLFRLLSGAWKGQDLGLSFNPDITQLVTVYSLLAFAGMVWFAQKGHYSLKTPWWQQVEHILYFCLFAFVAEGFLNYIFKTPLTRLWVGLSWALALPALLTGRWVARALLIRLGDWAIPTVLVGGWKNAAETAYALKSETYLTYHLKYAVLLGDRMDASPPFDHLHDDVPLRNTLEGLERDDYVVLCPDHKDQIIKQDLDTIYLVQARYAVVPPLENFPLYGLQPRFFFGYDIVLLEPCRKLKTPTGRLSKTLMDRVGAAVGLILLSPVFIGVAMKVKKDGGPAFFGHTRLGQNGKPFKCWKFRSMIVNSETVLETLLAADPAARAEWDKDFKLKNDPRITKIGQFIRKTSIDEIPQLFNVLKGEMSLVGPRPIVTDELKYYDDKITDYYAVKPGITGLWQVSGRNDISYAQRVYLDSWYVNHWSLWNDFVILFKTVCVILCRRGAY